ncbi:GNAT family N-acetyltransferase [uncultured Sneathiella sp.]|uniref:GNAT family N-acetyltransferase n=1 Tax=uncultured Sneathiella sp. TaxID=879315 RepID=UPI0030EC020C|tara:strand:- start:1854 stop:3029 length:1176 start_codon:yes stop_codon:yes gene_type:complete
MLNMESGIVSVFTAMADIPAKDWDRCAGPDHPYVQHRHLLALEESGIASPENGFHPRHIILRDKTGKVVAAAPAYLKDHSEGELGVDLGLAMAHTRAAGPYYPKLQVEVPMTPIAGPRLLVCAGENEAETRQTLLAALRQQAEKDSASSVQITYMTAPEWDATETAGFLKSEGNAYVWHNPGANTFDDILAAMHSRGRSKVRRERKKVAAEGLTYRSYRGDSLTAELAAPFFEMYAATYNHNKTELWHNLAYFEQIFNTMADVQDLTFAYKGEELVAMQLSFLSEETIYAHHWGHSGDIRFLHFELGIYQTYETALAGGKSAINFGTTGQHKAERGIAMEPAYHSLWFRAPDFAEIAEFGIKRKRAAAAKERVEENARLPYANGAEKESGR